MWQDCQLIADTILYGLSYLPFGQFLIHVTIGTTIGRIYLSTLLW